MIIALCAHQPQGNYGTDIEQLSTYQPFDHYACSGFAEPSKAAQRRRRMSTTISPAEHSRLVSRVTR
jgi:hypothetical protein